MIFTLPSNGTTYRAHFFHLCLVANFSRKYVITHYFCPVKTFSLMNTPNDAKLEPENRALFNPIIRRLKLKISLLYSLLLGSLSCCKH